MVELDTLQLISYRPPISIHECAMKLHEVSKQLLNHPFYFIVHSLEPTINSEIAVHSEMFDNVQHPMVNCVFKR